MMIMGVDYHPSSQTVAFFVEETGEYGEQELSHSDGQAEKFYRDLKQRGICVRVGMEATGYSRWFESSRTQTSRKKTLPNISSKIVAPDGRNLKNSCPRSNWQNGTPRSQRLRTSSAHELHPPDSRLPS
jgi:hypothetical protein